MRYNKRIMLFFEKTFAAITAAALLLSAGGALAQQTPPASLPSTAPLLRTTFAEGTDGWTAVGKNSKLTQTVENTKQALRWDYATQKGDLSVLMLPVPFAGALGQAKILRFAVKCSAQTPLVVVLSEKNGGRYLATFSPPEGIWQNVELAPGDFLLAEGPNDPKDPNHHLDMDQVESIGLTDMTQLFLQSDNKALLSLFDVKPGDRHLFLSSFGVYPGGVAANVPGADYNEAEGRIDTFSHPQVGWLALNAASVKRTGAGFQATYHQSNEHPVVLVRSFPPSLLAAKKNLSLVLTSAKPAKIMVQLEGKSGNKWKILFDIAGQNTRKTWAFPFTEFAADEENKLVDGKTEVFDPAHLHQITVIDISGITDGADDDNTLTLSGLVVK